MIEYRDFAPKQLAAPALFKAASFDTLDTAVAAANEWIAAHGVEVINVETIVLPNLWSTHSAGTTDPNRVLQPGFAEAWNQFVRVWYRRA